MNFLISKKQLITAAMVFALSLAAYINWEQTKRTDSILPTQSDKNTLVNQIDSAADKKDDAAYGEAYFAEAKLSRTKSRDEAMEAMRYMLKDAKLSTAEMRNLTTQATAMARSIETEGKIENLIKAKGFKECMVYLDTSKVDVLVHGNNLSTEQVTQIKDAILGEVTIPNEKISIIEIN